MNCATLHHPRMQLSDCLLFFIGFFSLTQVRFGFSIGISEIFVYLWAPFLFLKNLTLLRRHGMMFFINFGILMSIVCVISGLYNHQYTYFIFRGLASTYPLFAFPVVLHHLLWKNMRGLRWLLLGVCFSGIVNIFVFQASVEVTRYGAGASTAKAESIMEGPIFWIGRLLPFVMLPVNGWFMKTPTVYSVCAPIAMAVFSMATSVSGRSTALGALGGGLIAVVGGRRLKTIKRFCKLFYLLMIISGVGIFCMNKLYHVAAEQGWLGEAALVKYEHQTRGKKDILHLLMGGRGEFFIGAIAALEKPIIGHGPWAMDEGEHRHDFVLKYGDDEERAALERDMAYAQSLGIRTVGFIPAHSHVIGFWLWFGVIGLLYWLYVIFAIFRYLRMEAAAVPQWFGFLAIGAPAMLWQLFFSGFGFRIVTLPYVIALIMAHNVYKKRIPVSNDVKVELFYCENRK